MSDVLDRRRTSDHTHTQTAPGRTAQLHVRMGVSHLKEMRKKEGEEEGEEEDDGIGYVRANKYVYSPPVTNNVGTTHRHTGTQAHTGTHYYELP